MDDSKTLELWYTNVLQYIFGVLSYMDLVVGRKVEHSTYAIM